jgi:hypothetical protein
MKSLFALDRICRLLASLGILCLPVGWGACQRHPGADPGKAAGTSGIRIARNGVAQPAAPAHAVDATAQAGTSQEAARYERDIRPIFVRRGCAGGSCHSAFRGGGFYFTGNDERELPNVISRIDRKQPEKSELLLKATGVAQHNGGINIAVGSCDYRRLLAWISGQPDVLCSDDAPRDAKRFAREVVPALRALGCAECHSQPGPAMQHLDLSVVKQPEAQVATSEVTPGVQALFDKVSAMPQYAISPWGSPLLRAILASDGKHKQVFDRRSCALRRVYGYIAEAPELSCDVNIPGATPGMPSFEVYVKQVYPALAKRACFDTTCHGGGVPEMMLRGPSETDGLGGWHDYLMLTARIEDFAKPDKSTFLSTVRNEQPHGGGQRLGGAGDCVDDVTTAWLHNKPIQPCRKPLPPSYERFVQEVQPVLDKMTCTQARCHGFSLPHYVVRPFAKDAKTLRENYEWTLRKIDVEYMPFSEIMLRMREPCAYRKVGAWIENKPAITCEIITPPPSAFPKLADNPPHEKMKPGAPPPVRKS